MVLKPNKKERRVIKEEDIVLIEDDSKKHLDWPLARIEKLIVGKGGVIRVASLKTAKGVCKRLIQRIYPLEIGYNDEEEDNVNLNERFKIMRFNAKEQNTVQAVDCEPGENPGVNCEADSKNKNCKSGDSNVPDIRTRSGRVSKKPEFYKS